MSCFKNGIFDFKNNLVSHIESVHNVQNPESFVFENNDKFYCPICLESALHLNQEELFNHIDTHSESDSF